MADSGSNFREYIQIAFSDSLIEGKCYSVAFYTNLQNRIKKAANNIGAYISKTPITITTSPYLLNYTPQILLPGNPVITDTLNWTKVSGLYVAEGGEKYITIGNFKNDSSTTTQVVDTAGFGIIYYYIDDVSLIPCTDTNDAVIEYEDPFHLKLFPNPNDGNMTASYTLKQNDKALFTIYDVMGKEMNDYKLNSSSDKLEIKDLHLKNGIYFYRVIVNDRVVKSDKIVIMSKY